MTTDPPRIPLDPVGGDLFRSVEAGAQDVADHGSGRDERQQEGAGQRAGKQPHERGDGVPVRRGIDEHQPVDPLTVLEPDGGEQRDPSSQGVADQHHTGQPQGVEETGDERCLVNGGVPAVVRFGGKAKPLQVEEVGGVAVRGDEPAQVVPGGDGCGIAMDQDNRDRSGSFDLVRQAGPFDGDGAIPWREAAAHGATANGRRN